MRITEKPMDIEWAIDKDLSFPKNVFVVQARPETVWSAKVMETPTRIEEGKHEEELKVAVKGLSAGKKRLRRRHSKSCFYS